MKYKVAVLSCPHCGHEKVIKNLDDKCIFTYTCKRCKHISLAKINQEIFEFENLVPTNMKWKQE